MAAPLYTFSREITVGQSPKEAQQAFSGYFTSWLGGGRFLPEDQRPESLTYTRRSFHTWQIVVAILFFPIGLLALLAEKREERINVLIQEGPKPGTSVLSVTGALNQNKRGGAGQFFGRLDEFDPATRDGRAVSAPERER